MRIWHYLYFPTEEMAGVVANDLRAAGCGVEVRESTPQWLVLAHDELTEQDALEARAERLEELAGANGGEYDGWERETPAAQLPVKNEPIQFD
jgi:regulator of ribonuclease activity B